LKRLWPSRLAVTRGDAARNMGVPVVIGGKGVEKIIELSLNAEEQEMLKKSAASVQSVVNVVKGAA
jgi:malate dehydrogenase